ncbi:MAG: hypothetical protein JWM11_7664 [Planctomycetaceae bacterium]|nr:hypothetical protein [Planctomycetaceae bacterium]
MDSRCRLTPIPGHNLCCNLRLQRCIQLSPNLSTIISAQINDAHDQIATYHRLDTITALQFNLRLQCGSHVFENRTVRIKGRKACFPATTLHVNRMKLQFGRDWFDVCLTVDDRVPQPDLVSSPKQIQSQDKVDTIRPVVTVSNCLNSFL